MSYQINIASAKVLVIDDEPEITDIVQTFLHEAGYQVMVENAPDKAIEVAQNFQPDIILLDIMMPDVNGYDICEALKQDPQFVSTPVILPTY